MNDTERMLMEYCGLTEGQFADLADACNGTLKKMNGARHEVMSLLINPQLQATDAGRGYYDRARNVIDRNFDACPDVIANFQDMGKAARLLNKQTPDRPVRSVHVKILVAVGRQPGVHFRHLVSIYSHAEVRAMEKAGLIKARSFPWIKDLGWSWFTLPVDMIHVIEDLNKVLGGAS